MRTVGVEEEFVLVDLERRSVCGAAPRVLAREPEPDDGEIEAELTNEQLETGSAPHRSLVALGDSLTDLRRAAAAEAAAEGVGLAATATSPTAADPSVTHKPRYERMQTEFGLTAWEQLTCGCHVHVAVDSPAEAVGALDRIRPWLSALLAITVNSPFWQGTDTGYGSYRTQVWQRWPTAGPTGTFGTPAEYDRVVAELIGTGAALDDGMIYFDARLSRHYPTLELRVADVCLAVPDAVLLAGLARALVVTGATDWAEGRPPPEPRLEVLRAAQWRAARHGMGADLVDVERGERVPAWQLLDRLVERVRPALEDAGDLATVTDLLAELRGRGTGADRQLAAYRRRGDMNDLVELLLTATVP